VNSVIPIDETSAHWTPQFWPAPMERVYDIWHHGPPKLPVCGISVTATTTARCHREGEPGVWYGTDQYDALFAELQRHLLEEVDPQFILRRVALLTIRVPSVDLTDDRTLRSMRLTRESLVSDDWSLTQSVAAASRTAGVPALVMPSAALFGARNLVILDAGAAVVKTVHDAVVTADRLRYPPDEAMWR
jgi:hypothetical protein